MPSILPGFKIQCSVWFTLTLTLVIPTWQASGDDGDETIRFYLSRSKMVVAGEIKTEPIRSVKEAGVVSYRFEFQVSHHITGPVPGPSIPVNVIRHELTEDDAIPPLKKGKKCILFLKPTGDWVIPTWESVDAWFGVQSDSAAMHKALGRFTQGSRRRMPTNYDPVDSLLGNLRDYDLQIRTEAIDILGLKREKRAIEPLIELLADQRGLDGSDNYVGGHAANALHAITNGPFSISQKEWKDWLKKNERTESPTRELKTK